MDLRNKNNKHQNFFGVSDVSGGHFPNVVFCGRFYWKVMVFTVTWCGKDLLQLHPSFPGGGGKHMGKIFRLSVSLKTLGRWFSTQCFTAFQKPNLLILGVAPSLTISVGIFRGFFLGAHGPFFTLNCGDDGREIHPKRKIKCPQIRFRNYSFICPGFDVILLMIQICKTTLDLFFFRK